MPRKCTLTVALGSLLMIVAGCARGRSPQASSPDWAGHKRPLHARDLPRGTATDPPPATWIHYHEMEVPYAHHRREAEPAAPSGTKRLALVPVPGCRCGELALSLTGGDVQLLGGSKDLRALAKGDLPQVLTEVRAGTLWVWVDGARPGYGYTVHVTSDPADALLADPVGAVTHKEFLRYPIVAGKSLRSTTGRLVRIETLRVPEVD